jgi:hypothetical protein
MLLFPCAFSKHFLRFVAQIQYSHPWKVLRKRTRKGWFGLPKSSFGEHKVVTKDSSIPENQHITCCYFVTKDSRIPENQHITCCYDLL